MTRAEATDWLTLRYQDQVARYPLTANIPLSLYVRRNLQGAMALTSDAAAGLTPR